MVEGDIVRVESEAVKVEGGTVMGEGEEGEAVSVGNYMDPG